MTIAKAMKGTTQMNKSTIDMAREVYGAHTEWSGAPLDRLEQLVALVRADEREQALAAPVQKGWKLVPVVATREIEDAIGKARNLKASEIWEDALAATPPAQPAPVQEPFGYGRMLWDDKLFLPTLPSVRDGGWMALYTARQHSASLLG
jgi:hypothetical protein